MLTALVMMICAFKNPQAVIDQPGPWILVIFEVMLEFVFAMIVLKAAGVL